MRTSSETKERITALFNNLELEENTIKWMSNVWQEKSFQNLRKKIFDLKKNVIIENVSTQEELDLARLTLDGNEEVFGVFQEAYVNVKTPKNEEV